MPHVFLLLPALVLSVMMPGAARAQESSYVPPADVETAAQSQHGTGCPYAETRYEASPLGRPARSYQPGQCRGQGGTFSETTYGVDAARDLAYEETTGEEGRQSRSYQDGFGQAAEAVADPNGIAAATEFTYDAAGRLTESRDPEGRPTTYRYDGRGLVVAKATPDADGDGDGDPTNEAAAAGHPDGPDFRYAYDAAGALRFWQDARLHASGKVGFQRYDGLGRPTFRGVAPLPQGTAFSGLDALRMAPYGFETDEANWTETRAYDAAPRMDEGPWSALSAVHAYQGWTLMSLPVDPQETHYDSLFTDVSLESAPFAFDRSYQVAEHLEAGRGYWAKFETGGAQAIEGTHLKVVTLDLDAGWNIIGGPSCPLPIAAAEDPAGILLPSTLYTTGRGGGYADATVLQPGRGYWLQTSAAGQVTLDCAALEGRGRLTAVASRAAAPAGGFRYGDVNDSGTLSVIDITKIRRHIAGTAPLDGAALLAADVNGDGAVNGLDVTLGQQRILGSISRLPAEERPWHTERYGYDPRGRVALRQVVAEGQRGLDAVVRSGYDRQGRLTWRQTLVGTERLGQWFDYDARGLLVAMYATRSSGGLPARPAAPEVTYTYAADGQFASAQHAGQAAAVRAYDAAGRLTAIDGYFAAPSGFGAEYDYLSNGDLERARFYQPGGPVEASGPVRPRYRQLYEYDALGRLAWADYQHRINGQNYGQGLAGAFDVSGPQGALTYDKSGNLQGLRRRGESGSLIDALSLDYEAGPDSRASSRLTAVQDAAGALHGWDAASGSFAYDENGAMTSAPAPYALEAALYDADADGGHAVAINAGGQLARYRYDAAGQRYLKATAEGSTYSLLGATGETLGRFTGIGRDTTGTTGGALLSWNLALPSGEAVGRIEADGARRYYLKDRLGSVRAVVDESGGVKETRDHYPFGLRMPGRGLTTGTPAKEGFTGHELDRETGLLYAGARYYMSALGRWTTVDPKAGEFPNWSPYNYSMNNPVNLVDPDGKAPCCLDFAVGIVKGSYGRAKQEATYVYNAVQTAEGRDQLLRSAAPIAPTGEQFSMDVYSDMLESGRAVVTEAASTLQNGSEEEIGQLIGAGLVGVAALALSKGKRGGPRLHAGKQGKHVRGHNNFDESRGRSELTHSDPQSLLDNRAGTGARSGNREHVDFGEEVGVYYKDGQRVGPTTRGTIHYDQDGNAHIVPAPPVEPTQNR